MDEGAVIKGWLIRKAGFLKSRYWFWLVEDKLMYAKTIPMFDSSVKCTTVDVSSVHQVRRTDSPMSFEVVSRKEHFSLTAATQAECDEWVVSLQRAMQRQPASSWIETPSASSRSLTELASSAGTSGSAEHGGSHLDDPEDGAAAAASLPHVRGSAAAAAEPASPSPQGRAAAAAPGEPPHAECERNVLRAASSPAEDEPTAVGSASHPDSMAAQLAVQVAKKKVLLHTYEEIVVPDKKQDDDGGATSAGAAIGLTLVKHEQPRRKSRSTHEQVITEDGAVELKNQKKRFSIKTTNSTATAAAMNSKGCKGLKGPSPYEEIILEEDSEQNAAADSGGGSFSGSAAAAASCAVQPPPATDAAKSRGGSKEIYYEVCLETGNEAPQPSPPDAGDRNGCDSSVVYSSVGPHLWLAAGAGSTATAAAWHQQQQQQQLHSRCIAAADELPTDGDDERPPPLPSPRPALQIFEAEDDTYAKLSESKSAPAAAAAASLEPPSRQTPLGLTALAKPAAATEPIARAVSDAALKMRAYRPQPYSHAVSALKEYLVGEGAFNIRVSASAAAASRLTGTALGRLKGRLGSC